MSAVWDRSAEFISDNLGALLPIALIAFFVPASIEGNFPDMRESGGATLDVILNFLSLGFAILSLWGSMTIIAMAGDPAKMETAGSLARARLLPAIAVWATVLLAIVVLTLPVPLLLWAQGVDLAALARGETFDLSASVTGPIALYWLLLMLFILWAIARLIAVTPLIVHERRMFSALGRSYALTRGVTLRIVGVLLLFVVVALVSSLAARTVFGSVFELVAGGEAGVSLAGVLTSVAVAGVQTAFSATAAVFVAKLTLALVARERAAMTA